MKLPLNWLRQWIDVDAPAAAIAEALTTRGFYVEDVATHGRSYPGIVIARVIEAGKHPNADKLKLCRVDDGKGELSIVCGAPNVTAEMIVPLATIGTVMPNGLTIERARIRGQESEGMLCSARELMMSDDHAGILDLRALWPGRALEVGLPLDHYLPAPEVVLEVEIPFNRPDGMGVLGLAREVKAALGGRWTSWAQARLSARPASDRARPTFDLEVEDAEGCPAYFAQVVENVDVAPSPDWLVRRLEAIGQRSINNVVDLTNLVLFELGQPLHAFDLARLAGPAIRIRRAHAGERLVTLDGRERTLDPEVLVIADRDRAVGLAGVMGGADSEVTSATRTLLLECACFQPQRVRRGARALGLATEASKRFERGVDPGVGEIAAARFLALLQELCPESRLGAWRQRRDAPAPRTVTLRASRCERLIGLPFSSARCADLLEGLEFRVQRVEPLIVSIPSWRPDVTQEDDLVEEVARSNGYDRIPEAALETGGSFARRSLRERLLARARAAMLAQGFNEAWTGSLVSEAEAAACAPLLGDPVALVRLVNPTSRESDALRPNLLPGLLRAVAHNLRNGASSVRLFEVGAGFLGRGTRLPEERLMLAAVLTGERWRHSHDAAPSAPAHAYDARAAVDLFDLKGHAEAWFGEMRVDATGWRAYSAPGWKPGAGAEVAVGTSRIAWAGTLGQSLLAAWGIEQPVHVFFALLEPLGAALEGAPRASLPARFPPVRRDLAFFVPRSVTHDRVAQSLAGSAGEMLRALELFDVYDGPGTPAGMKSLAFALQFQHAERTLTESEVEALQDRMVAAVTKECDGLLRKR